MHGWLPVAATRDMRMMHAAGHGAGEAKHHDDGSYVVLLVEL
jgi:hypothetical protein